MKRALATILAAGLLVGTTAQDFSTAVRKVRPALVGIFTEKVAVRLDTIREEPDYYQTRSLGSGFVIDTLGHVVTCNHVIAGYGAITVKLADGTLLDGDRVRVVGRDPVTDLAVLRIQAGQKLAPVSFGNSDELAVGEPVMALGNPLGLEVSASAGIVSAVSRWGLARRSGPDFQDFIQTDALVNPGNSGGPLVDREGRVVGVCSSVRGGPQGSTGIGFASPANLVREVARQIIKDGVVVRGHLGVSTQPISKPIREALGLMSSDGILVAAVKRNRPGMKAGVLPGDVITKLGDEPVTDVRAFQSEVARQQPGSSVSLTLIRRGRTLSVQAVLDEWPTASAEPARPLPIKNWLGLKVRNLAVADAQRGFLEYGVLVEEVEGGGPGSDAGLKPGDVIVEIGFNAVKSMAVFDEFRSRLAGAGRPLLFRAYRGREAFYTAVQP